MIKIVLTSIALIYIFYNFDFVNFYDSLLKFDIFGIFLVLIVNLLSFIIVALRWQFLSRYNCSFKASLESTFLCLGINNITPAKLGEVAKGFYLKQFYGYFVAKSMALMIIERLSDVIILGFLVCFVSYYIEITNVSIIVLLLIISLLFISLLFRYPKFFLKKIVKFSPKKTKQFLSNILKTIVRVSLKEWLITIILTVTIWFLYYLSLVLFSKFGTELKLDFFQILVVFLFASIGMALPSTPGGIGVFEAGVIFALSLYGIGKEEAFSFGLVFHMLQYIPTTLIALFILYKKDFNFRSGFEN